ncbi:MAG: EAL domain-containing protein [Sphingomonadales bacterium]|nr:EAL domain-containing protein [Sphingomonadales bacterium]MDE2171590.1 EAL domain-containing protein [Sphingomonadales bacterium]
MFARTLKRQRPSKGTTPVRIMIWATLLATICGALGAAEPLEDILRGGRNMIRMRPADQKIVVVGLDEKTYDHFGTVNFPRSADAKLIDNLMSMGARHVYFDRAYSELTVPTEDNKLVEALKNSHGRVSMGALTAVDKMTGERTSIAPNKIFLKFATIASLDGYISPFSLSMEVYYKRYIDSIAVPAVSSMISGRTGPVNTRFRPDWSIDMRTVPHFSFIDVVDNKVDPAQIRGKDVLVGATTSRMNDIRRIAGQGWVPGVYFHAVAAQTLREGTPRNWGWFPAEILAVLCSLALVFCKTRRQAGLTTLVAVALLAGIPFILDAHFITADFIPAYLLFGIVAYRAMVLRAVNQAQRQHAGTLLPNLSALREAPDASHQPLVAMRIRNFAAICSSFSESMDTLLINELVRRLSLPGQENTFYQAEDMLYWLAPRLPADELAGHIEGLARLVETQMIFGDRKIDVQVSFGLDDEYDRPVASRIASAMLAADRAASRNQLWRFHQSDSEGDTSWQLSLVGEMDNALDQGDIWVAYQPQFTIDNLRVIGAEALVRWQHPERGSISPETFVLAAEAHNRILRLTLYVLERAIADALRIVQKRPGFRLSVNLSASLFTQPDMAARIAGVLATTGFPPASLTLEITETAHITENAKANDILAQLTAMGIQISIDDYGTGNATLDYLKSFPCDEVKIDRKFVTHVTTNPDDRLMVESTIALAHRLNRRVIAEGIEDRPTLDLLRQLGCDIAQGYHLGKPMRFKDLATMVFPSRTPRAA